MNTQVPSLPKTVHFVSLGCPKNLVDSEIMLGHLRKIGVELVKTPQQAEVIIVNTCGFIDSAKRESIDTILDVARYKQEGACRGLLVAGCLAQRYRSDIAKELPEVDAFFGPDECGKIGSIVQDVWAKVGGNRTYPLLPEEPFAYIAQTGRPLYLYDHETPRVALTPRHYAYVKISEGCDNPCKFCIIPRLRGRFRSRPMESIVAEIKSMVERGVREVILIAQDLTDYGLDTYGERRLGGLLEKIQEVEGLRWIRLLYAYPAHVTEDLMDAMARLPKVCRYLDMPVQHLTDAMLLGMGRRLGKNETEDLIQRLRQRIPGLAIRTSLIVGMPGETEEIFQELLVGMQELRFERLGVFTYSREEGTAAYRMKGRVRETEKKRRRAILMARQQEISRAINEAHVGRALEVILDGADEKRSGVFVGRTAWDSPGIDNTVLVHADNLAAGDFVNVKITKASSYDMEGMPAESPEPAYAI